jgi:hypothetical protein
MSALLQGVPLMQASDGLLYMTLAAGVPHHVHNGIPYEADGSIAGSGSNPSHYHQGLGFTSEGRLCTASVNPDYIGNGAAPFLDGRLSVGPNVVTHVSSGVGYQASNRLNYVAGAPPDPFIWAGTVGVGTDNAGFYGFQTALYGDIAPPAIDGININYLRAAVNLTIQLRMAGDVGIPEVDTNSINIYFEGYSLAPTVLNWTTNRYVSAIDEALYDFVASRLGSNINFKMEEILPP